MKAFFTLILTSFLFVQSFAQLDSLSIGVNKKDISFYSLSSKTKTTLANDDWHLAFSPKKQEFPSKTLQAAAIRINEANGVSLYKIPGLGLNDFDNVDTTGWRSWEKLHDSDTLIWMGAFNQNLDISQFNYGWGAYNQITHNVTGNSLFLVELPNGDLKKLAVLRNEWDTAFIVRYSPISISSLDTVLFINKMPFRNKNYVYVDLNTNSIVDREPIGTSWDVNFSVYADADGKKQIGFLLNNGVTALGNQILDPQSPCPSNLTFNDDYNALGKLGNNNDTLNEVFLPENVSYIKDAVGRVFSISYSYANTASNTLYFTTTQCSGATSIEQINSNAIAIYPNPAKDFIVITNSASMTSPAEIVMCDVTGKVCLASTLQDATSKVNIGHLENGVYFMRTTINGKLSTSKLVVYK